MLEFKPILPEDYGKINSLLSNKAEFSCEKTFINIFGWQQLYKNMYALEDGVLALKSGEGDSEHFQLPICNDIALGIEKIKAYKANAQPVFFAQSGARFDEFKQKYADEYFFENCRDAYDYIYLTENLANLSGKKYHSKRNHISVFSKNYKWHFEIIGENNIEKVIACANLWYKENAEKSDKYMLAEKQNLMFLLKNYGLFNLLGGAVIIDNSVVAFTVASEINSQVLDIHFEKALAQYKTAYSVINNSFASYVKDMYMYLNREDDLGLLGLRKAKLSYHPDMLVKKYICTPKPIVEQCINIYREAFGDDGEFEKTLFSNCFKYLKQYRKNGKTASICFALPVALVTEDGLKNGCYLYAAATRRAERGKGYMSALIEKIKAEYDFVITYPASDTLCEFYKRNGFTAINATTGNLPERIIPLGDFITVAEGEEIPQNKDYLLYVYGAEFKNIEKIKFDYIMAE